MRNRINVLLLASIVTTLLVAGLFYFKDRSAESLDSLDLSSVGLVVEQDLNALTELVSNSDILIAQSQCGNETCSENECCCLNTDTGAQCCRALKNHANCIEACKKSNPC